MQLTALIEHLDKELLARAGGPEISMHTMLAYQMLRALKDIEEARDHDEELTNAERVATGDDYDAIMRILGTRASEIRLAVLKDRVDNAKADADAHTGDASKGWKYQAARADWSDYLDVHDPVPASATAPLPEPKWKCRKCGGTKVQISLPTWYRETNDGSLDFVDADVEADVLYWHCEDCETTESGEPRRVSKGANAEKLRTLVAQIARMETDGEVQERTDSDCMSGDDAAATLSRLIVEARALVRPRRVTKKVA